MLNFRQWHQERRSAAKRKGSPAETIWQRPGAVAAHLNMTAALVRFWRFYENALEVQPLLTNMANTAVRAPGNLSTAP